MALRLALGLANGKEFLSRGLNGNRGVEDLAVRGKIFSGFPQVDAGLDEL